MEKPLAGKVALVTGGARRIGKAIALALAEAGAEVAITFRECPEADVAETLKALGAHSSGFHCDLNDVSDIRSTVSALTREYGRLDLLVNSAGRFESVAPGDITPEQWDLMFAANTRAPFFMAQACYPHLAASAGRIVNIGSLGGVEAWATHAHYCASKAALHMMTRALAKAWGPEVAVNCVAPGMIEQGEPGLVRFAGKTPSGRNGSAEDIAEAVLWLATGAGFVTGQVLVVDGGLGL